jgi:hypothetical protein
VIRANQAQAAEFSVHVVSVLDGDTIEVLHNHHAERIRLNGIDCPEGGQAIEEATVSNMREFAAIVEVLERTRLCTKHDLYDIITEFRPSVRDVPALSPQACGPFPKGKGRR